MKLSDFDYHLPPERIAQTPVEPRSASRLLVLERETGKITHTHFEHIGNFLNSGDLLVVNETRVIPARLPARKAETGGQIEILLLNQRNETTWEALVGGKRMGVGKRFELSNGLLGEVIEELESAKRLVQFEQAVNPYLDLVGQTPLPPYIHETLEDPNRYQTVYAQQSGSAAAPTAGLHFTPELLTQLDHQGIGLAKVTLHVGLDTFAPVTEEDVAEHHIHSEWCQLTQETAETINHTRQIGGRVIAVGTTSVRTLESAAEGDIVRPFEGATSLYILPGYPFKIVDCMVTNFHLPKSTLLMLVSAFAGREKILQVYQTAIEQQYRFYSFGDAMLMI